MRIARRKRRQALGPPHDHIPIPDDPAETLGKPLPFGALSLQQRNLFGVFAHPNQVESKIGFEALLLEIEVDQRRADPLGERRSEDCIYQRAPYQITGDLEFGTEYMQWRRRRQTPQDDDKRRQRHDRTQQSDANVQRLLDEQFDVISDALIRIVGGIATQLHAIVIGTMKPLAEIVRGHPAPPTDLEPLVQVKLIDGKADVECRQNGKDCDLGDETLPVLLLKRIVKTIVPLIQQHVYQDQGKFDGDHRRQ